MALAFLAAIAAALPSWGDEIALQPARGERIHAAWQVSVGDINRPSSRTEETMRRFDIDDRYRKDPAGALQTLERVARREPQTELIYALAELSWIEGRRAEGRRKGNGGRALAYYIDTVAYAYDYLFDPALATGRSPTDPRYRLACDLYNAALDRLIRAARTQQKLALGDEIELKIQGTTMAMRLELWPETPWKPGDVDELILASDYEVTGLDGRNRRYGLGVPLIAVCKQDAADDAGGFRPPEMAYPLTAILRPNRPLRDLAGVSVDEVRACTIDLVDPIEKRSIGQSQDAVAIESDITTPLAYMWSRTDLDKYRWTGLFRPGDGLKRSGLIPLRPYEPDKIPVVMVHGLLSTPLAWIPMLNELLRDPAIEERYQFLLYLYPTGVPLPIAASGLRDALSDMRRRYHGAGAAEAFDQTVLLGHSMGGLLAHAMALKSGNHLWQISTDRDFDDILGPPETLEELRHYTFFEWVPSVKRVVFLATPHRGSDYSTHFVGKLGSGLISEPDQYTRLLTQLVRENPNAFPPRFKRLPTSIETLESNSAILEALLKMQPNPEARFHSIIGSLRPDHVVNTTDGVVPYKSAHLDGVGEKIVRSDHGVQKDPAAIQEVRRILLEHIAAPAAPRVAELPTLEAPERR